LNIDLLPERIRQTMVSKDQRDVYLRTDGQVQAQDILDVIDRLKEGGIERVGIVALPRGR
jgi:biopolymer transport protein ExbD